MASSSQVAGQKRKVAFEKPASTSNARKRQKNLDARMIPVQRGTMAFPPSGELNIASFIKAREFEINALDKSMRKSRKALMARAFQQVPRHMRRRTASHNAKKVPRRLRRRAEREMKEDNTPTVTKRSRTPSRKLRVRLDRARLLGNLNKKTKTVRQRQKDTKAKVKETDPENHVSVSRVPRLKKNKLAQAPRATIKYKKRQVNKTWLPTHLWHTKRAHMTRPTEPLWRMAIPLRPTEKSYRPSHRAAGQRGSIAWDASYMSTVACKGTEAALEGLLRAIGFTPHCFTPSLQRKWKAGTRFAKGWVYEHDNEKRAIAVATVIWCVRPPTSTSSVNSTKQLDQEKDTEMSGTGTGVSDAQTKPKTKLDHQILIRIHPSAFHDLWQQLLKVAKMQKPQVLLEDLRFEIGSIEIQGPGSTESLLGVLRPFQSTVGDESVHSDVWTSLAGLNNPGILPQNSLLSFSIVDPRLNHPPKQVKIPKDSDTSTLNEVLVSWTPDKAPVASPLISHKSRWILSNSLPSQKAINRRRALAPPGQSPALSDKDPHIPVILLASKAENSDVRNSQGSWTLLLPWACVDLVWRSLMYYPLTSGGTPRFGGLNQIQQLTFEQQVPWFPADMPGTEAGKAWERTESERRFDEWIRRPPKHRIAWDKLDLGHGRLGEIGRGWACDWECLFDSTTEVADATRAVMIDKSAKQENKSPLTQRQRKAAKAKVEAEKETTARRRNTSSPESEGDDGVITPPEPDVKYFQLSPAASVAMLKPPSTRNLPPHPALSTVRITLLDRGTPSPAARIYRLPTTTPQPAAPHDTQSASNPESQAQPDHPQSWSSEPPAGQQPPPTMTTESSPATPSPSAQDLRARWLALVPRSSLTSSLSGLGPSRQSQRVPKQTTNRFGLPARQHAMTRESLANVNVLPKNAPQEIVDNYGPNSAFGRGDGEVPKEVTHPQPARTIGKGSGKRQKGKDKASSDARPGPTEQARRPDPTPSMPPPPPSISISTSPPICTQPRLGDPDPWLASRSSHSQHPPVPHAHDLIGFVTSGGYNLSEGRGTAIGSLWIQRVLEGWNATGAGVGVGNNESETTRFLCIVRNAGEAVGRLGRWEICDGP